MFGNRMSAPKLLDRRSAPERIADQAWDYLTTAVHSAGDNVRHSARGGARLARRTAAGLSDTAGDRVGSAADEAWVRANRAYDALAGRRPGLPWGLLIGAGLAGAAVGWAAGMAARAAAERADEEMRAAERVEFVDVDRPSPVAMDT
ncbi:hypothetical protein O7627_25160 [Solwaraspora sp. WMMD1047]|uniref:hypothetical protein n=1 Tax=Solwaraspora sp. WMMD1047 TaxID=3016102 RepID=UPI0024172A66|nr:hypothetical protein [Solwaraspora sp. WMMD1047]MDG4832574.1 hypothetical protein [Solwaraspora sp. WMMD1047]